LGYFCGCSGGYGHDLFLSAIMIFQRPKNNTTPLRASLWAFLIGFVSLFVQFCKNEAPPPVADSGDPALQRLTKLLAADPTNDSLLYMRGRVYWELEAYDEAMSDAITALQRDSSHPRYYHLLSDILLDYGRPNDSKRALDVLNMAANRFPDHQHTWLKLAEFNLIVRQHGEALKALDHVLKRDPQNAEAFFMSGRVALDMGDTIRAITSLEKSVSFDAENTDAWVMLGRIFTNRANPRAIQFFDNALRLDTTNVEVQEYKAGYYKRTGQFDEAFKLYRGILAHHPDYANALFDMGLMYTELDSLVTAEKHFDMAIATDPLFVIAVYYRGVTRELQGNLQGAIEDYTNANKMSPNLPEPIEALQRLKVKPK
jgi:tetratricopeptide (TPR) repeat protein